jgi:hypothetical protein
MTKNDHFGDEYSALVNDVTANLEDYIYSPLSPISWWNNTIDCESIVKFVLMTYALLGGDL